MVIMKRTQEKGGQGDWIKGGELFPGDPCREIMQSHDKANRQGWWLPKGSLLPHGFDFLRATRIKAMS